MGQLEEQYSQYSDDRTELPPETPSQKNHSCLLYLCAVKLVNLQPFDFLKNAWIGEKWYVHLKAKLITIDMKEWFSKLVQL